MTDAIASGRLKSFVERIERLEEDRASVSADLKEVYAEAKGDGFDTKTIRKVIKERAKDAAKRQEEEAIFGLYWSAVQGDLFDDTRVTITANGGEPVHTTAGAMRRAAAKLERAA